MVVVVVVMAHFVCVWCYFWLGFLVFFVCLFVFVVVVVLGAGLFVCFLGVVGVCSIVVFFNSAFVMIRRLSLILLEWP